MCEHIQYIQSTCIHYAVFKHSRYDSVVYYYTVHLEMKSLHINIYIYGKATLHFIQVCELYIFFFLPEVTSPEMTSDVK